MTELKTLKDIDIESIGNIMFFQLVIQNYRDNVRQLAINWIYELEKNTMTTDGLSSEDMWDYMARSHDNNLKIEWIKHFFDITDSELK